MRLADNQSVIYVTSDCLGVVRGLPVAGARRSRRIHGPNGDLWEELFSRLDSWKGRLTIEWHPSHSEPALLWAGTVYVEPYIGNLYADVLAKASADIHEVSFTIAAAIGREDAKLLKVASRLVAIIKHIEDAQPYLDAEAQAAFEHRARLERRKRARDRARLRATPVTELAERRGHQLRKRGRR